MGIGAREQKSGRVSVCLADGLVSSWGQVISSNRSALPPGEARAITQFSNPRGRAQPLGTLCSYCQHTSDTVVRKLLARKHPNRAAISDNIWKEGVERETRGSSAKLTFGSIIFR